MADATCKELDCCKPVATRGWCQSHYNAWRLYGDPAPRGRTPLPFPDNMLTRMRPQPNGCIWLDSKPTSGGYALVRGPNRRTVLAHRAAYELFVGPIPEGMTIDHVCHNESGCTLTDHTCPHRRCVNWEHLRVATHAANNAASPNSLVSRTHCVNGHEFTEANTYLYKGKYRCCRQCRRKASQRSAARRRVRPND